MFNCESSFTHLSKVQAFSITTGDSSKGVMTAKPTISRNTKNLIILSNGKRILFGYIDKNLIKFKQQSPSSFVATVKERLLNKRLGHPGNSPLCSMGSPIKYLLSYLQPEQNPSDSFQKSIQTWLLLFSYSG
ncbi:hypothetical protein O181_070291 [Austropuccinia psidii MF-1]|uniref:Uncharacterized protein n=1 Tax=Austropuccinia psidii MF-1 TaxID=1389203 RepID=A0A9Q3I5J2_9BASI|nr:hypothetical protein [Austropuccinia psidii MF-1]